MNIDQQHNWYNLEPNYRNYLSAVKKIRPISIKNYISDIKYFYGWVATHETHSVSPTTVLTEKVLEDYKSYLVTCNIPARTVNRRLSSLRSFCEYLLSQNIIQSDPSKHIRNHTTKPHIEDDILGKFEQSLVSQGISNEDFEQIRSDVREFIQFSHITSL